MFNIDDLCPTNAPKRCADCKESYHIRKHCQKSLTLLNEKDKLKAIPLVGQHQLLTSRPYEQYPNTSTNNNPFPFYSQYYYPINGYQYSMPVMSQQRIWTQPYSNESPVVYTHLPYHLNQQQQPINNSNRYFYSNNQRRKCFLCGSPNHLKANCPQFQANNLRR